MPEASHQFELESSEFEGLVNTGKVPFVLSLRRARAVRAAAQRIAGVVELPARKELES
jgi:hypothetical protein